MNKKLHTWWVDTGLYHKQLPVKTDGMEKARQEAYKKLITMSYEEFMKYVTLNVSGMKFNL